MTPLRALALSLAGLSGAPAALAQSLAFDPGFDGRFAFGVTDRVPGADIFLFGDATARLGFDGALGLELGVFGLADALDTPHETYGAVTWDPATGGRFAIGVPRPAYDGFAASGLEGPFLSLGVARTATSRSAATFGAMFGNALPLGLRFENETARLRYAASVHAVPNQDSTIAGIGIAYPMPGWTLEGAFEVAWGSGTEVAGKLQAHGRAGRVSGGLGLFLPGANAAAEAVELFGAFEAGERVTISGVVQVPLDGATDPSGGAAVSYAINENINLSAGILTDVGADAAFNALIDFRF